VERGCRDELSIANKALEHGRVFACGMRLDRNRLVLYRHIGLYILYDARENVTILSANFVKLARSSLREASKLIQSSIKVRWK
jgi:hypothetical protein